MVVLMHLHKFVMNILQIKPIKITNTLLLCYRYVLFTAQCLGRKYIFIFLEIYLNLYKELHNQAHF